MVETLMCKDLGLGLLNPVELVLNRAGRLRYKELMARFESFEKKFEKFGLEPFFSASS